MKYILLIMVAFTTFAVSGTLVHMNGRDDHYSLRYIMWKYGVHPYPAEIMPYAMIRDQGSANLVKGKTIEQLKYMFPGEEFQIKDVPPGYFSHDPIDKQYILLEGTGVIIFLRDGKGQRVTTIKTFL